MRIFLTLVVFAGSGVIIDGVLAQTKEQPKTSDKGFPTTLSPVNPVKYYGPRKDKKKKKKTVTYDAKNEYYDRVEKAWRDQEKREKSFSAGEGTDRMKPPYFGHRKPPKIRPIGSRKYCKICGIRH